MAEQWKPVSSFGTTGTIYAKGNERKIVNSNMRDFHYMFEAVRLVKALPKK